MPRLKLLLLLKLVLMLACAVVFYRAIEASEKSTDVASTKSADGKQTSEGEGGGKGDKIAVPQIPSGQLSIGEAAELRTQLELLKRDVEQKITKLSQAKKSYDKAKTDIDLKLKRIVEERTLLKETLQQEKKSKEERLSEALEFVAKMEARKAAPVIEGMDRDLVLHLFRKLPPRQVTKILESVNPKKATELMEYYTRIRSGREFDLMREMGLCQSSEKDDDETKKSGDTTTRKPGDDASKSVQASAPDTVAK